MSRRTWLVSISIGAHFAIGLGLFASGIWKLERLENDSRIGAIGVMTPTQALGGAPADLPKPEFKKKEQVEKKVVKNVQWDKRVETKDTPKIAENTTGGGTGNGLGTGTGENTGDDDGEIGGETCGAPPCIGDLKLPEPPKVTLIPTPVAPHVLSALRISGETQIHPTRNVKLAMDRDGKRKVTGTAKVCIQTTGAISSVSMMASTKYSEYDQQLLEAMRRWHYRPYTVNGVAQPACSAVSFVYVMQ